jgi:hypothetical protein
VLTRVSLAANNVGHVAQSLVPRVTIRLVIGWLYLCKIFGVRGVRPRDLPHMQRLNTTSASQWSRPLFLVINPGHIIFKFGLCYVGKGGGPGLKPRPMVLFTIYIYIYIRIVLAGAQFHM